MSTVMNRKSLEVIKYANTPDFDKSQWIINPDLSKVQSVPKKYWMVRGDEVIPVTEQARKNMDEAEIGKLKEERYVDFEKNTINAVLQGFEYPAGSGTKVSIGEEDRLTLFGLCQLTMSPETYPVTINNRHGGKITLNNQGDVQTLFKTDLANRLNVQKAELELKRRVRESQTIEAVKFVADRRV